MWSLTSFKAKGNVVEFLNPSPGAALPLNPRPYMVMFSWRFVQWRLFLVFYNQEISFRTSQLSLSVWLVPSNPCECSGYADEKRRTRCYFSLVRRESVRVCSSTKSSKILHGPIRSLPARGHHNPCTPSGMNSNPWHTTSLLNENTQDRQSETPHHPPPHTHTHIPCMPAWQEVGW